MKPPISRSPASQLLLSRSSMASRVIAAVLGMLLAQPAWAEWVDLGRIEPFGLRAYVDPATLRKTVNGRRVWYLSTNPSAPSDDIINSSTKFLLEIDCIRERMRINQHSTNSGYMGNGPTLSNDVSVGAWFVPQPNDHMERALKFTCAMRLPK